MDALFDTAGLSPSDVKTLYIAGASAARSTRRPPRASASSPPRSRAGCPRPGNAAGMGACMIAASQRALDDAEALARDARVLDLTESPVFRERFVEEMIFGSPEG